LKELAPAASTMVSAGISVDGSVSDGDDADAAARTFRVKVDKLIRDLMFFCHVHVHGREVNSVVQIELIDFNGFKQGIHHYDTSSFILSLSICLIMH
jgi:hypothetical protein